MSDHEETKTRPNNSTPKIKLTDWYNSEKSGDPIDWLKTQIFIINLEKGNMSEGAVIQLLLSHVQATELRMKIINELSKTKQAATATLSEFEDVFKKNLKRDIITYRNDLRNLKYNSTFNMREFYSRITGLVSKSMNLDEDRDSESITKLSMDEFISKIPSSIREALQSSNHTDGFDLAENAEKIRSYQRLYLAKNDAEANNFEKMQIQPQKNSIENNSDAQHNEKEYQEYQDRNNSFVNNSEIKPQEYQQYNSQSHRYGYQNQCYVPQTQWQPRNNSNSGYNSFRNNFLGNGPQCTQYRGQYNDNRNNSGWNNQRNRPNSMTCLYCNKPNHRYQNCWNLESDINLGRTDPNWQPNPNRGHINNMVTLPASEDRREENPLFSQSDGQ